MPFSTTEISTAGKASLDHYLKNNPIDQVALDRVWLRQLMKRKKPVPGGKQYVTAQVRYKYQNNGQWFYGNEQVTYNNRESLEQAQYPWRSMHDGYAISEDRLAQNGIIMTDGPGRNASKAEVLQLTNLLDEQNEILRLGTEEFMNEQCLLDGTQDTDAPVGLDGLVSLSPSSGTVGGLAASNAWWQNHAATGLTTTTTTGTILDKMEIAWRACVRNGGRPDFIMCGSDFLDGYRNFMLKSFGTLNHQGGSEISIEGGTKMVAFHGVPVMWNPSFSDLDTTYSPATAWEKRCYFINARHVWMAPLQGQDMVTRKPPRVYDRYVNYFGLTWRGAVVMDRRNAHAVISIS